MPCVMHKETSNAYGLDGKNIIVNKESTGTLSTFCGNTTNRNLVVIEKKSVIPLRDEVTRNKASNGLGVGEVGGPCPTLTTVDIHSVFYEAYQHNGHRESGTSGKSMADQNRGIRSDTHLACKEVKGYDGQQFEGNTLDKPKSIKDILKKAAKRVTYVIRRLTPVECERLQGYPDNWTKYGADGMEIADTARYRAIGNSICVFCAERVYLGILDALTEVAENDRGQQDAV